MLHYKNCSFVYCLVNIKLEKCKNNRQDEKSVFISFLCQLFHRPKRQKYTKLHYSDFRDTMLNILPTLYFKNKSLN